MAVPTQADLTGQIVKGYQIEERVGKGGFGEVYRAVQSLVNREVAVKIVLPEYANNPDFVRRFEAEAQLVANLEHLHIVPLYDYWRDQTGAYLVMRWYRGGSLYDVLKNGHWPINDVTRIVDQISAALAVAHRNNVIHRDLKPANILLDEERNAYLADFGIAKDAGNISEHAAAIAAEEAAADGFIGSPDYISPEQIRSEAITTRSDIYNMGLLLYELLVGKKPFDNLPISTLISKHLMEPLPEVTIERPELPDELDDVIARATQKDPADRYDDILQLAADFRRALEQTEPDEIKRLDHRTQPAFVLDTLQKRAAAILIEPDNPYKGLRAFTEADADDFFGREPLVASLIKRLQDGEMLSRFLTLIGPSGSGKSSVVRAGLIPRLRRGAISESDGWFYVEMTPGGHPMEELEAALLRVAINPPASLLQQLNENARGLARAIKRVLPQEAETELVIFIDQFEEVFTMVESEAERQHFLNSLAEAAKDPHCRLRLLTTLRADFYDRPLLYPEFGHLLSENSVTVLPLTHDQLHDAITKPAENVGLVMDRELVAQIIAEVGEQPGTLPLLQYALTELFERREGRRLTLEAYQAIGGVTGALARRADDLYDQLDNRQQQAARQLFLRLVTLGEGQEDTRRRASLAELFSLEVRDDIMQQVIDLFGKFRLLTFDNDPITRIPTVEVAHEALIRQWKLLRGWLDDSRDDVRTQRRVAQAAAEWHKANHDASYLARGTQLETFEEWLKSTRLALSDDERHYVQASLQERERLHRLEEERRQREEALAARNRSILRVFVIVLAIATVGALGLSAFAFNQQSIALENAATATIAQGQALIESNAAATQAAIAEENRDIAQENENNARTLAFIANAQLALANGLTDQAILLALEANHTAMSTVQTLRVLAQAAYTPGTRRLFTQSEDRVEAVAYLPSGAQALSGGRDNVMLLLDLDSGEVLRRYEGHQDWIYDIQVSPTGDHALTASADGTLIEWDLATGAALQTLEGHDGVVRAVHYFPDGTGAISVSESGEFFVWDLASGTISARSADRIASTIRSLAISPSGFTALSGQEDGSIIFWRVDNAAILSAFTAENGGHEASVWGLDYTPDERGFVSASEDATLLLWTFEAAQPVLEFTGGHTARVTSVDFNSDGTRIVSGSEDTTVVLWDAETAAVMNRFIGHDFLVYDVAFAPNDNQVLSGAWDATVREWDINYGAQVREYGTGAIRHTADVRGVAFSPDGALAASASLDGTAIVWDTATGAVVHHLTDGHSAGLNAVTFSEDGRYLATGADDNAVILWDASTGELLRRYEGHSDAVWALAFSPDGALLASGGRDNTLILWDVESGEQINRLFGHTFRVTDADFNPDGRLLVTSSYDGTLILWRVESGDIVRRMEGHEDWVLSAEFSADGALIASSSSDNTILLWETQSGEQIRRYEGHTALVNNVDFNSDATALVSSGDDGDIILWDLASGEVLQRLTGHTDAVKASTFSPDGMQILSGSDDNSVRLWAVRLTVDALRDWLQNNRQLREFTCVERARFNIVPLCAQPTPQVSGSA